MEHHAFVCFTDKASVSLERLIKTEAFFQNKEIEKIEVDKFSIGKARYLIQQAFIKPIEQNKKLIIVNASSIMVEAAQALLKILEEPPLTVQFLFFLPDGLNLLPTLNSRLQKIEFKMAEEKSQNCDIFDNFIALNYKERIVFIEKELKKENSNWVADFKRDLIVKLAKEAATFSLDVLNSLDFVVTNLNMRGSSNKLLLEELALSVPLVSKK